MFEHGEAVTRQRGTAASSRYSTQQTRIDWSSPDEETTEGWGVDDSRSEEPLEAGRTSIVTDYVLYRDAPADVLAGDRLIIRTRTCEVVGDPATWNNPLTGTEAGFVVRANIVGG